MPDTHTIALFVTASLVVLLIPGPAVFFICARSLERGRSAGVVSALGLSTGTSVQVVAAMAGLSALVLRSAAVFGAIKYLGAAYLVHLGLRTLRASTDDSTVKEKPGASYLGLFGTGFVVGLLNPKLALFFLAFLPTFVDPYGASPVMQIAFLGALFVALGTVTDVTYALLVGSARHLLGSASNARRRGRTVSGATYIGLGLYTALSRGGLRG